MHTCIFHKCNLHSESFYDSKQLLWTVTKMCGKGAKDGNNKQSWGLVDCFVHAYSSSASTLVFHVVYLSEDPLRDGEQHFYTAVRNLCWSAALPKGVMHCVVISLREDKVGGFLPICIFLSLSFTRLTFNHHVTKNIYC